MFWRRTSLLEGERHEETYAQQAFRARSTVGITRGTASSLPAVRPEKRASGTTDTKPAGANNTYVSNDRMCARISLGCPARQPAAYVVWGSGEALRTQDGLPLKSSTNQWCSGVPRRCANPWLSAATPSARLVQGLCICERSWQDESRKRRFFPPPTYRSQSKRETLGPLFRLA